MGYTPLVRWRNFTLANLKEMLTLFPDLSSKTSRDFVVEEIDNNFGGYKKTAYQFCCQLGLEERGKYFRTQNYLYAFNDSELEKYLNFWFKMYVCPNPFVASDEPPISPFYELSNLILKSSTLKYSLSQFCLDFFGDGKSYDIFKNAVKNYCSPIKLDKDDDTLFIHENEILIESTLSFTIS